MNRLTFLRPLVRWMNGLPLWRVGRVHVWGHRLRAPNFDRRLCLLLHRFGWMGKADRAFLLTHVRPGMILVDVGANQGLYTLLFSARVGPAGRVFAFEPDDMLYAALADNLAHNQARNVQAFHLALGSQRGTMTLYRSLLNSGDNRLAVDGRGDGPWEPVQIRVDRLDEILAGQRIDFIKMDVQGWEMEALRGMETLLADPRNNGLVIYFEYWPKGLRDAGSDPLEPLSFLAARGFHLFRPVGETLAHIGDLTSFADSADTENYMNLYATRHPTF